MYFLNELYPLITFSKIRGEVSLGLSAPPIEDVTKAGVVGPANNNLFLKSAISERNETLPLKSIGDDGGPFRQSRMMLEQQELAVRRNTTQEEKYRGDITSRSYAAQVIGLHEDLNCALWVSNLPYAP